MNPAQICATGVPALLLALTIAGCATRTDVAREKSADEKIAFYQARVGGPGTYPAYARLGRALLQKFRETGDEDCYDDALRCFRQSLDYQRNVDALIGMAIGLSERHFFKEALPYAEEAVAAVPSDFEARGVVFDIQLALGNIPEAQRCLDGMLRTQTNFHSLCRQAALIEYRGDPAGALAAMVQARNDADGALPASVSAWAEVRIGSLHLALCDAARAREAYDRALALAPGYFFALEHVAEWHAAQGHWTEAEGLFCRLLELRPEPSYRLGLAEACRQQGDIGEASREEQTAVAELQHAARDGGQDSFRPLALLLLEHPETAAEGLRRAEQDWQVRQDALTADTLAWAHHRNGNNSEALRLSELALQSGSRHPALLLHGGLIRCRSGRVAEGRALLQQALACPLSFGPRERVLAEEAEQVR